MENNNAAHERLSPPRRACNRKHEDSNISMVAGAVVLGVVVVVGVVDKVGAASLP